MSWHWPSRFKKAGPCVGIGESKKQAELYVDLPGLRTCCTAHLGKTGCRCCFSTWRAGWFQMQLDVRLGWGIQAGFLYHSSYFCTFEMSHSKTFLMKKLTAKTSQLFTSSPPHREAWACFSPASAEDRRLPSGGNGSLWIRTRGHSWDFLAQHLSVCREHVLGGAHEGPGCNPLPTFHRRESIKKSGRLLWGEKC